MFINRPTLCRYSRTLPPECALWSLVSYFPKLPDRIISSRRYRPASTSGLQKHVLLRKSENHLLHIHHSRREPRQSKPLQRAHSLHLMFPRSDPSGRYEYHIVIHQLPQPYTLMEDMSEDMQQVIHEVKTYGRMAEPQCMVLQLELQPFLSLEPSSVFPPAERRK